MSQENQPAGAILATVATPAEAPADRLTKGQYLALFGGIGGAVLTILGNVLVHQYYQPNLRFDVGSYYRTADMAITSVKLTNFGNGDAEDIVLTATLPEPLIRDVTSSNDGIKVVTTRGG